MTDDEILDAAAFGPQQGLRTPDAIILRAVEIARERGAECERWVKRIKLLEKRCERIAAIAGGRDDG